MSDDEMTVRLSIRGRVQGVWYRGWTVDTALRIGLDGWVRNRTDGSVEALLSGPRAKVEEMIEACRRGPPAARVDHLSITPDPAQPELGFRQLPTS